MTVHRTARRQATPGGLWLSLVLLGSCSPGTNDPVATVSTGNLSGAVVETMGSTPIAGATVMAGNKQTTSAADGSFELLELPVGSTRLSVSAPEFDPFEESISIQSGANQRDVRLAEQTWYKYGVGTDSFGVYIPPAADRLRGVLFVIGGAGGPSLSLVRGGPNIYPAEILDAAAFIEWHQGLRSFADAQSFALLGEQASRAATGSGVDLVRRAVATLPEVVRSHPELQHAPLLLLGQSWGASRVHEFTAAEGERVIGFVAMKGAGAQTPAPRAQSVPGYLFIGELDTAINPATITTTFQVNRQAGAPWALAVEPGARHTYVSDLNLIIEWMATVAELRLPEQVTPGQNVVLRTVDATRGWLANRATFEICDYTCYSADRAKAAWLPSMQSARRWQALVTRGTGTQ
jgi:dienelactone hydrolase